MPFTLNPLPPAIDLETKAILKKAAIAHRYLAELKHRIRSSHPSVYSQDLINNLFFYPYTKIEFLERDLNVSRPTAAKYLDVLVRTRRFPEKRKN